jgi:hypothetical protein
VAGKSNEKNSISPVGTVNLLRGRRNGDRCSKSSERSRRISGNFGEFVPGSDPGRALFAMERSAQQMPFQQEVLPNRAEAREERPCTFRATKATHS